MLLPSISPLAFAACGHSLDAADTAAKLAQLVQLYGGIGYGVVGDESSARCICVTSGSFSQACNVATWQAVSGVRKSVPVASGGGIFRDREQVGALAALMTAMTTWKRIGVGVAGQEDA